MFAVKLNKSHLVNWIECSSPQSTNDEILLHVDYSGVCKTDAKIATQGHRDLVLPRIIGHECCGHTESGTSYVVWPGKACGYCEFCNSGRENLCPEMQIIGFHRDGCLAENVVVPKNSLISLPVGISKKLAVFAEPLACALNAVEQFSRSDNELLISGGGTCGLLLVMAAFSQGLSSTVYEPDTEKFMRASEFANFAEVKNELPRKKFHYAVNATADTSAVNDGINLLQSAGEYCLFSGLNKQDNISADILNQIHYRQLTIKGAYGCTREQMTRALSIIAAESSAFELLIEDIISLKQVPDILDKVADGKSYRFIVEI